MKTIFIAVGTRRPNVKGGAARARKPANNTRKGKNPNANKGGKGKGKEGKASQEDLDKEMDACKYLKYNNIASSNGPLLIRLVRSRQRT